MPKFRAAIPQNNISRPTSVIKPNVVHYLADVGGCGHWRMIWPASTLMLQDKAFVEQKNRLVNIPDYYTGINVIRVQRQANPDIVHHYQKLAEAKQKYGYRMIYESDDIIFKEDLPEYNRAGEHFNEKTTKAALDIIDCCDEITVSTPFLADYYKQKSNNKKVTVIPNYAPKHWLDRYYNRNDIINRFEKNSNKLRVLYAGSPCHTNSTDKDIKDDFSHLNELIAKSTDEFKWVFFGTIPKSLMPLVDAKLIEYYPWCSLQEYPTMINALDINISIAPLIDNTFNRAKSNIKYLEAGCFGIPCICQNICTYSMADIKFNTADDMIEELRKLKDKDYYMEFSDKSRKYANTMWLEDNIDKFVELYKYPYGSNMRHQLSTVCCD